MATDLKSILQRKKEYAERTERPSFDWFGIPVNSTVKVVFLQELDKELADDKGAARYLVEHTSPENFKRKAECTFDEETGERCFACEMAQEFPKVAEGSWWAKTNFYVQVYVEGKDDKPGKGKVKVLSRPVSPKGGDFFDLLLTWATEENDGRVTGQTFQISKGAEKTSPWTLMPTNKVLEVPDTAELIDLEKAVGLRVEYDKQKGFYMPGGNTGSKPATAEAGIEQPAVKKAEDTSVW
jgi:hypothetical protein